MYFDLILLIGFQSTLDLGLDVSRIKQVLREFLMHHRKDFPSRDELIAAVLDAQFNEPVADLTEELWYVMLYFRYFVIVNLSFFHFL